MKAIVEKYQIAGVDERERGFSRLADVERDETGYQAVLRYETSLTMSQPYDTPAGALAGLIAALQANGYSQLRSRLNFRGTEYLGSQEPWIEYPDAVPRESILPRPLTQLARRTGWIGRVLRLFSS